MCSSATRTSRSCAPAADGCPGARPLTTLTALQAGWAAWPPELPLAAYRAAQGLVVEPSDAVAAGLPVQRLAEKDLRPASAVVDVLLRLSPACRCGVATYFQPGKGLDHWTTEYRSPDGGRWVRVDTELLGSTSSSGPTTWRPASS